MYIYYTRECVGTPPTPTGWEDKTPITVREKCEYRKGYEEKKKQKAY
jgi:hypothetical protein